MDITYETIIKYLVKKDKHVNKPEVLSVKNFVTQKNIFNYATTFPNKFKDLFTDKFYRLGITVYDKDKNNISFWSSLLSLIDKDFIIPFSSDEHSMISLFKNELLEQYNKTKLTPLLKDMDKVDIRERFKLMPDIITFQYIVDILDINIFVFDFETENISAVYNKDIMNPWKQTFLFAKYENVWEPIMLVKTKGEIQRTFDYNNLNVRKIMLSNNLVQYYIGSDKEYIYMNNISDVIDLERNKLQKNMIIIKKPSSSGKTVIDDEQSSETSSSSVKTEASSEVNDDTDNELFINNDIIEEIKNLNKTKLNKMKVAEVTELCKKLKIVFDKENPTKPIMIEKILAKK